MTYTILACIFLILYVLTRATWAFACFIAKPLAVLAVVALAVLWAGGALGSLGGQALHWERAVDVDSVTIHKRPRTDMRLRQIAREHGLKTNLGMARLYQNQDTGEYVCYIDYRRGLPNELEAQVLRHEARHCNGWIHR